MTRFDSSSSMTSSRSGRRSTSTEPSGLERHRADAAVRGDVLVLLADRLLQEVDLELARLARELLGRDELALERVEAVEQRDREAARRAEARVGRHVGQAVQLEPAGDAGHAERRLEDAVLDLVDRVDDLALASRRGGWCSGSAARRRRRRTCRRRRRRGSRRARASSSGGRCRLRRERSARARGRRSWRRLLVRRCRSSSASPSGEPISKNLSWASRPASASAPRGRAAARRARAGSPAGSAAMTLATERGRAVVDVVEARGRVGASSRSAAPTRRRSTTFEASQRPSFLKTAMTPSQSSCARRMRSGSA